MVSASLHGHGPTPREREMIALSEAGLSASQIAAQIGISSKTVARRLAELSTEEGPADRAFFARIRTGSQALAAAIAASHGAHPA